MQLSGALLLYSIQVKCYSAPLPSSTTHHFTFVMNLWNTTVSNDGGSTWTPVGSPTEALGDDVTYVRFQTKAGLSYTCMDSNTATRTLVDTAAFS